ncbi:MAG: pantetheine-phosphate adenylyltransferase [Bacteroidales bacterium]|nr:pantetheine-phosphate adenylyltransferase [Bacteroidales bacterium]
MATALFPGSFDPVTKGHESIVKKALPMFDKIIVAIGENTSKKTMFSLQMRKKWLQDTFKDYDNVEIDSYNCLTTDYCKLKDVRFILRGIRDTADFQYEKNISDINTVLDSSIETVFLLADKEESTISSSFVREMLLFGKDVKAFIPDKVVITDKDICRQ